MTDLTQAQGGTEFAIRCDNCNTILTGAHAVGNLTRHKRSLKCGSSGQRKDYACPRCGKVYHRSDALLNHNRKHHGAPPGAPRYPGQSPES
ncbi:hypothetical protein K458DRAFT_419657 [Lentithecium fluviatile CBS 122367]|uniref:C2H2-type domain-containing protein n=1 Tax=Lentithecium fluviatile CBS 122367 TaxID=1168545 RepID=A0A6G1IXH6_9PLEO|nr:hypothetical protein K458DRAFT_419657 [Lentithecium fluviatile CBS 122367]